MKNTILIILSFLFSIALTGQAITDQPVNAVICANETTASFTVVTDGNHTTLQWEESSDGTTNWTNISGANALTLSVSIDVNAILSYRLMVDITSSDVVTTMVKPQPVVDDETEIVCSDDALDINLLDNDDANNDITVDFTYIVSSSDATNVASAGDRTTASSANITDTYINTTSADVTITYTVTPYTIDACAGDDFTVMVTVKPEPVGSNQTDSTCSDAALSHDLDAAITNGATGVTYSWIAAANASVTGESTAAQTGATINDTITNTNNSDQIVIYTVTPTGANGCEGNTFPLTVTVNPLPQPSLSGETSVCKNSTYVLYKVDVPNSNSAYSWDVGNNEIANDRVDSLYVNWINLTGDGFVQVIETDNSGCQDSISLLITQNGTAPQTDSIIVKKIFGSNCLLIFKDSTINFYEWGRTEISTGDEESLTETGQYILLDNCSDLNQYYYWVEISNDMTCNKRVYYQEPSWIATNTLGVTQVDNLGDVLVYPNPNYGQFNIRFENTLRDVEVSVYNKLGQLVLQRHLGFVGQNESYPINMEDRSSGLYFVRVYHPETESSVFKKVMIQR
jgi:hypothetical protein